LRLWSHVLFIFWTIFANLFDMCAELWFVYWIAGGFGSYLLGLNRKTYEQAGVDTEGNTPGSTKEPGIGWMTGFLFVSSFVGLLALVPLRKVKCFLQFSWWIDCLCFISAGVLEVILHELMIASFQLNLNLNRQWSRLLLSVTYEAWIGLWSCIFCCPRSW
jgi:hypothetical protein